MGIYHRWLGILFFYSPLFSRSMRVLSLFSSIMIMLFVQSLTYDIADPDDGSCELCEEESCCISLRSTLNSQESRCHWSQSFFILTIQLIVIRIREVNHVIFDQSIMI